MDLLDASVALKRLSNFHCRYYGKKVIILLDAFILEFKVRDPQEENTLLDTAKDALRQIKEMRYAALLEEKGIAGDRIWCYGFAFEGKKVLIL
ncbi:MAG: hypothetical protein HFH35_07665 [Eubacterium sp.]|nr:hypothetical protein [Eubacterium sp.]